VHANGEHLRRAAILKRSSTAVVSATRSQRIIVVFFLCLDVALQLVWFSNAKYKDAAASSFSLFRVYPSLLLSVLVAPSYSLDCNPRPSHFNMSAGYDAFPAGVRVKPTPFRVSMSEERLSEMKQLISLAKVSPVTYEGLQQDRKYGITRQWLEGAKETWKQFDWCACNFLIVEII